MKKIICIIPIAVILGLLASILRGYELAFGFDLVTDLPIEGARMTPALLVLALAIAAGAFFLVRKVKFEAKEAKKSIAHTAASLFGAAAMFALGGYVLFTNHMGEVILYLFAALCFLNAISLAILGMKNLVADDNPIYSLVAFFQVLWATLAVILIFRERVSEPIAEHFVFLLFAYLCILLFTYAQIGYVYGKNRLAVAYIVGCLGAYFCAIELVAPFIASAFNAEYFLNLDFKIIIPLATYLVYMPISLHKMLRNENNV